MNYRKIKIVRTEDSSEDRLVVTQERMAKFTGGENGKPLKVCGITLMASRMGEVEGRAVYLPRGYDWSVVQGQGGIYLVAIK